MGNPQETLQVKRIFDRNVGFVDTAKPASQVGGILVKFNQPIILNTQTIALRFNCQMAQGAHDTKIPNGHCPAISTNGMHCIAMTFIINCRGLVAWQGGPIACGQVPELKQLVQSL